MKLLTIIIPCYNSQDYMNKAIQSCLGIDERIEIIIVNDGSSDNTSEIAHKFEKEYPEIVVAIDQENKGHGGAVNTGLKNATGTYVRVLDSDDSFNKSSLKRLLRAIEQFSRDDEYADVIITNFVYDKVDKTKKKIMSYTNMFRENEILSWNDVKKCKLGQYILMHSCTFKKTVICDKAKLNLPEHTFYVDNLYVYVTMHHVRSLYYINTNLYKYFIGREDQSVNEEVMLKRINQQIKVNKMMIEEYDPTLIINKNQEDLIIGYLSTILMVSSVLLNKIDNNDARYYKKALWQYLKTNNLYAYKKVRNSAKGILSNLNSKAGIMIINIGYKIAKLLYGFN